MFGLMRPKKELVGKRLRAVKEELGVSLTELGDRLGLIKPTINSYVQGYTLAPPEVLEQIAKITGKSVGWFYFGDIEEYIQDYLYKKGQEAILLECPELPTKLKERIMNRDNWDRSWQNEFGYPCEEVLDHVFTEVCHEKRKNLSDIGSDYSSLKYYFSQDMVKKMLDADKERLTGEFNLARETVEYLDFLLEMITSLQKIVYKQGTQIKELQETLEK